MIGDYHDGSSDEDGEEGLRLRIPCSLTLSQREMRDEKKAEYQEIYVGLIVTRWIRLGKEIEEEEFLQDEYYLCCSYHC